MEKKCSHQAIQQYKSEINKYLKNKGISDVSKYKVYIKDDKLFFDKWEYGNIEKPTNITIQNILDILKYQEMYLRIIYFDLSIRPIPQHMTINARGMIGHDNINNEEIIGLFGLDIEVSNGYMVEREQILSSKFRLLNGLLRTNSEINRSDITITNFNGKIRILIFYINS